MIPIDLITGFLGSGKTTFLKKYARYLLDQGLSIGILENDYGAVNVDMMLLQELEGEKCELEMVAGGCDYDCHRRRMKSKLILMGMSGYDRVVMEPSGIFDVDELFDVLCEEPLNRWFEVGNVIAVVDAGLEENLSGQAEYLLSAQTAVAGKVVLSKVQTVPEETISRVIQHVNRALKAVGCERVFQAPCKQGECTDRVQEKLSESGSQAEGNLDESGKIIRAPLRPASDTVLAKNWDELSEADFAELISCGYVQEHHKKLPVDRDNDFETEYYLDLGLKKEELIRRIETLLTDEGCGHIFRIKGFCRDEEGKWIEINLTHQNREIRPVASGQDVIIVIGEGLNKERIDKTLKPM
ncbi:MAG: GTPase (G3E family) [Lachnospiraceae bacterium]|nr:GTPase (G3E family) [Lachnospiraceae bacterium]